MFVVSAADPYIEHGLPDVLGADRDRYAGARTLVGAGHSAANTLLFLAELATQAPGTSVVWAIHAATPASTYGGETADALPARGAIGTRLREHIEAGTIELVTPESDAIIGGTAPASTYQQAGPLALMHGELLWMS